jgi:hypothetical protein
MSFDQDFSGSSQSTSASSESSLRIEVTIGDVYRLMEQARYLEGPARGRLWVAPGLDATDIERARRFGEIRRFAAGDARAAIAEGARAHSN